VPAARAAISNGYDDGMVRDANASSATGHVDWAVIGSGFGGSVAALRLAQKGWSVAVLEQGRRWPATELPASTRELRKSYWAPRLGARGLLRMDLLRHLLALGGVGVGGGSLVYGNTLFDPLPSFFARPEIARLGPLAPYYDLARAMLGVVPNPRLGPVDDALRATAAELGRGDTFRPSPVGVFFGDPERDTPDPYFDGEGPARRGCTACGACFVGCRQGAKNTLDRNYLWLAERLGVVIHADTRVVAIRPRSPHAAAGGGAGGDGADGYVLDLADPARPGRVTRTLRAGGVVIAAGVLGTLELLLSAQARGDLPRLSPRLGHDVRSNSEAIVGVTARGDVDWSAGLAASSSVFPDDHTQVQADRYPAGSDTMALMSTLLVDGGGAIPRPLRFVAAALRHPVDLLRIAWPVGFARKSVILVVMQDLESRLRIVRGRGGLDSRADGPFPTHLPVANEFARRLAARLDAIPRSAVPEVFLDRPATAHLLGGCVIGASPDEGVVDLQQRAHGYRGLLVCDGSVIPANLGVNPALSITAFAERALAHVPTRPGATRRALAIERRCGASAWLERGEGGT
jgi:cholesterol oxidase